MSVIFTCSSRRHQVPMNCGTKEDRIQSTGQPRISRLIIGINMLVHQFALRYIKSSTKVFLLHWQSICDTIITFKLKLLQLTESLYIYLFMIILFPSLLKFTSVFFKLDQIPSLQVKLSSACSFFFFSSILLNEIRFLILLF